MYALLGGRNNKYVINTLRNDKYVIKKRFDLPNSECKLFQAWIVVISES